MKASTMVILIVGLALATSFQSVASETGLFLFLKKRGFKHLYFIKLITMLMDISYFL
jgi:hypothetical protein